MLNSVSCESWIIKNFKKAREELDVTLRNLSQLNCEGASFEEWTTLFCFIKSVLHMY